MKDLNTCEWNNSIKPGRSRPYDVLRAVNEICEKALNDAKRGLHPLLRTVELDRLEQRGEFLQAYRCPLEKRIARKLAAWQPDVQAVFQFEDRRIADIDNWDGSIHLLVKVPRLSNTVEALGKEFDHALVRYLTQVGWQHFTIRRSILDVQQVTMSELRHAVCYGARFCAVDTAPIQVWPRDRQIE